MRQIAIALAEEIMRDFTVEMEPEIPNYCATWHRPKVLTKTLDELKEGVFNPPDKDLARIDRSYDDIGGNIRLERKLRILENILDLLEKEGDSY